MARTKKVKQDEVVTIVDDKNTEALLPQEVEPTGVEVIEEEKPVTYDPNESDEVSEVEEKEVEKVNAKQPVQASPTKQADTVTVCCNSYQDVIFAVRLPNGSLAEVKFNGNNKHLAGLEMGKNPIGGAFGMTFGVPSDMWELIKKQHKSDPRIINGLILHQPEIPALQKAQSTNAKSCVTGTSHLTRKRLLLQQPLLSKGA